MNKLVLLSSAVVLAFSACGKKDAGTTAQATQEATRKAPASVDLTDNPEVEKLARDALAAYRDKNVERLAELGPPGAKEKTIFIEPRNPRYEELLGDSSWRMKSLRAWDGQTIIRFERGVDVALAWYYQDETSRYAMELHKDNGRWAFHDLIQRPLDAAAGAPKQP